MLAAAWLYGRWTSKARSWALALAAIGLRGVISCRAASRPPGWLVSITLLVIGTNAILAMLLPYAAKSYPAATRGRAVGLIAACTKLGGPMAQGLTLVRMVPALGPSPW